MKAVISFMAVFVMSLGLTTMAQAHCDTLDGPVVQAARQALEKGEITPILKWIKKDQEPEIRAAFQKALAVRGKGPEAKDLADHYFFETLVRIHRAGEGAPYTGLSAGPPEAIIRAADESLEKGSVDHLVRQVTEAVASGIRKRFSDTAERRNMLRRMWRRVASLWNLTLISPIMWNGCTSMRLAVPDTGPPPKQLLNTSTNSI